MSHTGREESEELERKKSQSRPFVYITCKPFFLLSLEIWLQHCLQTQTLSGSMPNDTTLNPVFSKASPRALSWSSIRIHWKLVVNGQHNMMSNIRNVMYHINYFQGLPTSSKESCLVLLSLLTLSQIYYLHCSKFCLWSPLSQPIIM